jgi:hypothetical protein
MESDPSGFFSELSGHRNEVVTELHDQGYDHLIHYASVELLHDTYGIEVCGIPKEEDAEEILAILRQMFPSWTEGYTHCKDFGCDQGFVARIQRDPDPLRDHWEPGGLRLNQFADDHVYELPYPEGKTFQVIQGYGGSYSHRGRSFYSLDFGMPTNTPVCAARSGFVVEVEDQYAEGGTDWAYKNKANRVVISHEDGTAASYCHLRKRGVAVHLDQPVGAGEVIGYSGSTGWSGRPHLHFSISWLGEPIQTKFRTIDGTDIHLKEKLWYARPYGPDKIWRARLQWLLAKIARYRW